MAGRGFQHETILNSFFEEIVNHIFSRYSQLIIDMLIPLKCFKLLVKLLLRPGELHIVISQLRVTGKFIENTGLACLG